MWRASVAFPGESEPLATAAFDFDGVRYLDQPGTAEQWDAMVALERRLRSTRAVRDADAAHAGMV